MQPKAKLYRFRADSPAPPLASRNCLFILTVNWLLQGVRGMEPKELSFRLLLLATFALGGTILFEFWAALPLAPAIILSLLLAHTINFLINGQFWVCLRYCPGYRQDARRLRQRAQRLCDHVAARAWLAEAVVIGSAARGPAALQRRSDLDLRLVFPPGLAGWLKTNLLLLDLRARALVQRLPLDAYAYAQPAALRRFDQAEPLGILLDRAGRLRRDFADRQLVWLQ